MRNLEMAPASAGLEKVVVGSLRTVPRNLAPVFAWPLVCGSSVAERTRALSFADGVLQVEVADAGWKRELQNLAPRYVALMNRYLPHSLKTIAFVLPVNGQKV